MKKQHYASPVKFILSFVNKQKKVFVFQALLCLVWSLKESLFPYFIKRAVDNVYVTPEKSSALLYPFICLIVVWGAMEIAMRIQGFLSISAFPKFRQAIRIYMFSCICNTQYTQFVCNPVGEYADHINSIPSSCQRVLEILLLHFTSIFGALVVAVIVLLDVNICFSITLLLWIIAHLSIVKIINPKIAYYGDRHAESATELSGKINDVLLNFLSMKWYRREDYELSRLKEKQQCEIKKAYEAQIYFEKMRLYQSIFAIIYMIVMVSLMLLLWSKQLISIGDLILVPMLSFSTLGMVWWLTQEMNVLYRELNQIRFSLHFIEKIKNNAENQPYNTQNPANTTNALITCVNVCFSYHDQLLLKNFNLEMSDNTHLAIVGMSGSGKSTLIKLITGILQPQKGKIYLNHQDVSTLDPHLIGDLIAVIPQEPMLFNRTIFDNIHYGRLSATKDEVIAAAKVALCDDFITSLKKGYDTLTGEGGAQISTGQKQRIMIARAILSNASIIILDEPTASLDIMTEANLLKALKQVFKDKMLLLISHRINALSLVDKILVLKAGEIVEKGSIKMLYGKKGVFYQMFCHGQSVIESNRSL